MKLLAVLPLLNRLVEIALKIIRRKSAHSHHSVVGVNEPMKKDPNASASD